MPYAPKRPCLHPGCGALVSRGYCAAHAKSAPTRDYENRRKGDVSTLIRRGEKWTKTSRIIRAQNPLCCDPFNDHTTVPAYSEQVHHITPARQRPDLIFDPRNLAALCGRCHTGIEAMERGGTPTAHLFAGKTVADKYDAQSR